MSDETYYIFGKEFHQKWFEARPMSEAKKRDFQRTKQLESAKNIISKLDEINEFLEDAENIGVDVEFLKQLKKLLNKLAPYKTAAELGIDVVEAATEVESLLIQWYNEAYRTCEQQHGGKNANYYICVAAVDRKFQARNVDWVLNKNRKDSVVAKTWEKWKGRLLQMFTP